MYVYILGAYIDLLLATYLVFYIWREFAITICNLLRILCNKNSKFISCAGIKFQFESENMACTIIR